jgi:hypothetical protein
MSGARSGREPESLTAEVLAAVAEREGVEPIDLEPPLHDVVDPDALEALFADAIDGTAREDVSVEFTYRGHRVLVDGGTVHVLEADAQRDAPARE